MAEWSRIARRIRVPLGFVFAVLYFWLARPNWQFIGLGAILIVPGLLVRALASGHVRTQLVDRRRTCGDVLRHLSSGNPRRRKFFAREVSRIRRVCTASTENAPA